MKKINYENNWMVVRYPAKKNYALMFSLMFFVPWTRRRRSVFNLSCWRNSPKQRGCWNFMFNNKVLCFSF